MYRQIANILVILYGVSIVSAKHKITVEKVDIETVDKDYLNIDVHLINNTGDILIDVDVEFLKDIGYDMFIQVHIQIKPSADEEYATLYKSDIIDRCHFMEHKERYPILKLLLEDFKKYGNLIQECPVKAGKYSMKGYKFEATGPFEKLVNPGHYCFHFIMMKEIETNMKTLYSIKWYAVVEEP